MPNLQIVAGIAGKGAAAYDEGELRLPDGTLWYAEQLIAVTVLGGLDEPEHWSSRVLGGLKGGLSLASHLDLSPALSLASSALGAGLGAIEKDAKSQAIIEIEGPGGAVVALTAQGLPALMLHDRETCRRAQRRAVPMPASQTPDSPGSEDSLIDHSKRALANTWDALPDLTRLWKGSDPQKT